MTPLCNAEWIERTGVMAGIPRGAEARSVQVVFRVTPAGADVLDGLRGDMSRSDYMRLLIKLAQMKAAGQPDARRAKP